jgi:tripartite-type tricarboxylate transporter receptor subunit TctC
LDSAWWVENNPGGGGIAAARAALSAHGHTLALLTNGTSISVSLLKNLTFSPLTDFAPVTKTGTFEFFSQRMLMHPTAHWLT